MLLTNDIYTKERNNINTSIMEKGTAKLIY